MEALTLFGGNAAPPQPWEWLNLALAMTGVLVLSVPLAVQREFETPLLCKVAATFGLLIGFNPFGLQAMVFLYVTLLRSAAPTSAAVATGIYLITALCLSWIGFAPGQWKRRLV